MRTPRKRVCTAAVPTRDAKTWGDYPTAAAAAADGALVLRQDLSLLPHLVKVGVDEYDRLLRLGKFDPSTLTWIPAHYSSERMKTIVMKEFARRGIDGGGPEKWYSNLTSVGNIGSASIYVILDEMRTRDRDQGSRISDQGLTILFQSVDQIEL